MTETEIMPTVGDEVMEGTTRAVVTDIRGGVIWLRRPHGGGGTEWPAEDPRKLTVRRTRAEMIEAGDL
ncbi:hypothetical protein [Streptomyces sp. NPDC051992]|uniref:hypothetical protein n=1 Tax=Streptomyces sp. NPDC051992 TaxID=3161012 RepID=UPI003424D4F8